MNNMLHIFDYIAAPNLNGKGLGMIICQFKFPTVIPHGLIPNLLKYVFLFDIHSFMEDAIIQHGWTLTFHNIYGCNYEFMHQFKK